MMPTPTPTSPSSSPEFEFQFNPTITSPTSLHSADQLFSGGLLLPLHHLLPPNSLISPPDDPSPSLSKRWTHIFKKPQNPNQETTPNKIDKKINHHNRKNSSAAASSAELNINLWPFSRSRSAGNSSSSSSRKSTRKVSSAPCSRSNSAARPSGVHLGRASPVWHLPRATSRKEPPPESTRRSKTGKAAAGKGKGRSLGLKVPMCISYRNHLSCRSGQAGVVGGGGLGVAGNRGGNLFGLRSLFTKKVY